VQALRGKGWPPAASESCVGTGRPVRRSVDSEPSGRVIEPRKPAFRGSRHGFITCGGAEAPKWPGAEVPPGSKSAARRQGLVQEPGRSHRLRGKYAGGPAAIKGHSQAPGARPPVRARRRTPPRYRRAKENEARAGGTLGSRSASIVPRKRGNRPEGPRGGKRGVGTRNCWRERSRERRFPGRSLRNFSG
jgi:hypothetical protein